ncbi:putative bacteriocin ABC transporter [Eubacterium nodatum ATCC 33099]|nr:putative bacteriocin ABC transporter [Eubacterium nodatum ATCC 33099]
MIIGENITKSFGNKILFKDFNFHIEGGEFVCFSGESGAGKTTLLNIIGLLEPIDSGKLLINGREYKTNKDKRKFYAEEVGFLFQNFALLENKTVEQNLKIVKAKGNLSYRIDESLKIVGLTDKMNNKVYTLSGGEQQRIALARLILKPCNIILADEPTGSLDKRNAELVIGLLKKINSMGKTVIIVSHDEYVKNSADRIIEL